MLSKLSKIILGNDDFSANVTLYDLFRCKPVNQDFLDELASFDSALIVDEQITASSLGYYLLPKIYPYFSPNNCRIMSLEDKYMFANSGRNALIAEAGLGDEKLSSAIAALLV